MLDGEIRLPTPQPEPAAPLPCQSSVWIELQASVDQGKSNIDFFAEVGESVSSTNSGHRHHCRQPQAPAEKDQCPFGDLPPDRRSSR